MLIYIKLESVKPSRQDSGFFTEKESWTSVEIEIVASGDYMVTHEIKRADLYDKISPKYLFYMVGRERLERSTIGLKVRCSTN